MPAEKDGLRSADVCLSVSVLIDQSESRDWAQADQSEGRDWEQADQSEGRDGAQADQSEGRDGAQADQSEGRWRVCRHMLTN